jgi:hypothetical protein
MKHKPLNEPMNIVISGVESDRYFDIVVRQCGRRFVLMSYHYLQKKSKNFLKERLEEFPDLKIFIDSGAHTFLSNRDQYMDKDISFWETYLKNYSNWLIDNSEYIFACANLDIEAIVGNDQVDEWNDEYFKPVEQAGVEVCYIWHSDREQIGWAEMCKKHSYIGLSYENDARMTVQKLTKMVKTASKTNTRVHGMALTQAEILVRVPLFSADSTTWLVGQQYGELNWFDGRKMRRLAKKEWQRLYKTKLLREPFNADWDKLMTGMGGRGDTYELLRLNVIAYKLAEEHIRKRLRTKMYWLGSTTSLTASTMSFEDKLDQLDLPPFEWYVEGDNEGWEGYLEKLGISPDDYSKEEGVNVLYHFFVFLVDDSHIEDMDKDALFEYAKSVSSEPINDIDEAIEFLRDYFKENFMGERTDFIGESAGEDTPEPAKERRGYIEDDEFITIDLSADDLDTTYALAPPKDNSMPEVEAFDKELAQRDIVAVRDSNGKFVKGQTKVRKPKNIYSDKMPNLQCNTCYKAGDCEHYKPGYICAFKKQFKKFNTRNVDDILDAMTSIADANLGRLQKAMIFETMDGGMPTAEVTGLIDQNMRILNQIKDLQNSKAVVSQKSVIRADGTQETVTQVNVNPQHQGGILSTIFGGGSSKKEDTIVEADYEEAKDE